MSGFKINHQGIRQFTRELEREFAKNPVRVPVHAEPQGPGWSLPAATTVNNYHGPVVTVHGDGAQLAWGSATVNQSSQRVEQVAPGYEDLATLVTDLLANLDRLAVPADQVEDLHRSADEVLRQVTGIEPDTGIVRRAVTMIKGVLAPVALGTSDAIAAESTELVKDLIDALGRALPT